MKALELCSDILLIGGLAGLTASSVACLSAGQVTNGEAFAYFGLVSYVSSISSMVVGSAGEILVNHYYSKKE